MQEIMTGDTVTILSGDRKGETGEVISIARQERAHFIRRLYNVRLPDGSPESYEGITPKTDKGKEMAKPLGIEKVDQVAKASPAAKVDPPPKPAETAKETPKPVPLKG